MRFAVHMLLTTIQLRAEHSMVWLHVKGSRGQSSPAQTAALCGSASKENMDCWELGIFATVLL